MAEIHKIPKRSRLNQTRPPMLPEPVDEDLLARLDLPRYQPPKRAGRSRSRQRAQSQPLPEPPRALKPETQGKPDQKPLPSSPSTYRAPSEKLPQSPYTQRPPFNTALPPRQSTDPVRPASDRQPPGSTTPDSKPASASPAGSPSTPAKSSPAGNQPPSTNLPGTRTTNPLGARSSGPGASRPDAPSSGTPRAGGNRPGSFPAGSRPVGSQLPSRNQPKPENRSDPDESSEERNQPPARLTPRPSDPRHTYGSRPPGSRPMGSRPDSDPAQPRPFRLPPLDFSLPDPADAPKQVDQQTEEPAETQPEKRPEPAAPSFHFLDETPSLRDVLLNTEGMPAHTAILGVCEDQLPVLLDLNDPAPGSLLVISDERQQELDLLRVAIISVALRNTARGAQFIVFSHLPEAWNQWVDEQSLRRYCLGVIGAETIQAREWIYRLSEWAEQRAAQQREGPPVMVLFDTLSFMTRLSVDPRQKLETIIRDGPQVRIWSLAAVSTALASSLGRQLDGFNTRLWGYSEDPNFYTRMAGLPAVEARSFGAPGQFAVRVGPPGDQTWLKFRLPTFDGLLP